MAKYISQGTTLDVSTDGGTVYIPLSCQLTGFSGPGSTADEIEVTTLCSTAKEFIAGLNDWGSIALNGHFDPADVGVDQLRTLHESGAIADWKIVWSDADATEWTFQGYVSEFAVSAEQNTALGMTAAVRVSGAITESASPPI